MRASNVGSDPINPAYYAGTACAEIIEHMPANVAFAVKYAWRLGEKDSEDQEARKAAWYLRRQLKLDYRPFIGSMFVDFVRARVQPAYEAGKLDPARVAIVMACTSYTIDARPAHLERALSNFETFFQQNQG